MVNQVFSASEASGPTSDSGTERRRSVKSGADKLLEQEDDETEDQDEDIPTALGTHSTAQSVAVLFRATSVPQAQPRDEMSTLPEQPRSRGIASTAAQSATRSE